MSTGLLPLGMDQSVVVLSQEAKETWCAGFSVCAACLYVQLSALLQFAISTSGYFWFLTVLMPKNLASSPRTVGLAMVQSS